MDLNELQQNAAGVAVLKDWLGSGLAPVSQETADRRALACSEGNGGLECPHLRESRWWEKQVKNPVAETIKKWMEAKASMKLITKMDEHPRLCGVCGCCMPTKVWTPIEHIAAHTSETTLSKLPAWCWQRIEIESL